MRFLKGLAAAALISISFSVIPASGGIALPKTFGPDGPRPTTGFAVGPPVHVATGGHGFWEGYTAGSESPKRLIDDVNVFVGTDGFGNVYPGPQLPYGGDPDQPRLR